MNWTAHSIAQVQLGMKVSEAMPFRQTPKGQQTVDELLSPCDTIRTNYSDQAYVVRSITRHQWNGLHHWSLALSHPGESQVSAWINEIVAIDGRLLKLFGNNGDEVIPTTTPPIIDKQGQMMLFG